MKTLFIQLIVGLALLAGQTATWAQLTPAIPPNIVTSTPRPMIMLNMSKDHQLFYRAYDEFSDLDGDSLPETTYKHAFTYYGYFDPYKCYNYSGTSNKFSPASVNTDKYCSGNWSGNFLNWATMTRMDVVRKVLYGGQRSTDSASSTILERSSLPTDAHSFAKYYKGSDLTQLTPFSATQLASDKNISDYDNNNARRVIQYVSADNKLHRFSPGTVPAAAVANTCESKVDAFFVDNMDSRPTQYHCITHRMAFTTAFTIEKGDQIRAVNADNTAQYMEGFAVEVDLANGWFTMVVEPSGFVAATAVTIKKWNIKNLTQTSATICNTTLGNNLTENLPYNSNASTNGDSHTNVNPPLMRIAKGDYQLWNANERWQCYWSGEKGASNGNNVSVTGLGASASNPSKSNQGVVISGTGPDFIVRVDACVSSALIGTESCQEYPSGNFKPIGLLHEYGEGNLAEFGLMTGSFAKNISGGTLRSNMQSFRNEVNYTTNGTFTSTQGIVYTLNKLRIYGYRYSDGSYIGDGNCTYQLTSLSDNICTSWGNPLGEMFVESLRYLGGKTAASAAYNYTDAGSKDAALGLPKPAWIDPFTKGGPTAQAAAEAIFGQGQCRAVNAINFNASVTSYDSNDPNDAAQWATFGTLHTAPNLAAQVNIIGVDEGIHDAAKSWFIGSNGATNTGSCTAKVIDGVTTTLATANGICPDAPSYAGSYALAGAAYWARTHPVKEPSAADLKANKDAYKVKSFSVALSPGKPRIEVPHPTTAGAKVVIQPAYQLLVGGNVGNGTIVDFRVVGTPTATSGKYLIVWEDSEQGGDYDSDVSGILRYEVVGSKLYVYTRVFNAATANPQGFGYTISGTTRDGVHFHSGILGYTRADAGMIVTRTDGTAHGNILNGGCNNCQVNQDESRAEYDFGVTAASRLEDPLWYAAKWGGFSKMEDPDTSTPDSKEYYQKPLANKANWDVKKLDGTSGSDGIPDSYFLAVRPSELEKSLRSAFNAIVSASNTAPAVASAQIQAGSLKYLASFDGDDGHGELITFMVQSDGTFNVSLKDGALDRSIYHWAGHTKLTQTAAADRVIITNSTNTTGVAFNWSSLSDPIKTTALGGTDATAEAKLNWLRGSRVNESPSGLRFRKRNLNSIMGPVVNSNPTVMAPPNADYFGAAFPGYGAFVTLHKARQSIIWVGTGDGMLHGFDASSNATQGGTPVMSYVPQLVHSRLQDWVQPATEKVQSFVDGSPFSADVLLGSTVTSSSAAGYDAGAPAPAGWKTYVFSSLGRGAKGMFALDTTTPSALTEANAASIFKWQFSEADDTSGDLGYNLAQIGNPSRVSEAASPVAKMNNGKFAVLLPNGVNSTSGKAALYILFVNGPTAGTWTTGTNYIKLVADAGPANGLSQPTWIDTNNDGVADYIYAGDLKGNIWKFDVSSSDPNAWGMAYGGRQLFTTKSTDGTTRLPITTAPEYRFHPLGGVVINVATGKSISNADFPDTSGKINGIFGIWDKPIYSSQAYIDTPALLDDATNGLPRLRSQLAARSMIRITLDDIDPLNGKVGDGYVTGAAIDWTNNKGWYLNFPDSGEMTVSNPVITQGLLSTVSIAPAASSTEVCFKGPSAYVTFLDPISGLLEKSVFGSITINGVTYLLASIKITDQRVTFARDATKSVCASGEANCTRIIGETTDITAESANASARIYWREIPSFKTKAPE
nr:PilC/PilY family type IV pilus protein [uncultured Rhodoferax sp.]